MEKIKYFMMMALVAMFSITFTACDEDDETGEKQTAEDVIYMGQLVGDWFYDAIATSDEYAIVLSLNANKNFEFTGYSMPDGYYEEKEVVTGTWTVIGGKLVLKTNSEGTRRWEFNINNAGDKLTVKHDGETNTYAKIASEVGAKRLHDMLLMCGGWYNKTNNDMMVYNVKNLNECVYICDIYTNIDGDPTSAKGDFGTWKWEGNTFQEIFKSRTLTYKSIEVSETKFVETTTDNYKYEYERVDLAYLKKMLSVTSDIYGK